MINWNPLVNQELSLDGDYGHEDGYVETLEFDSGKKRTYLKNSFVPTEYPSLSLLLNNTIPTASGKTEFEEFRQWHDISLRYGILPFYLPRIGYRQKTFTRGEIGIYQFLPESLKYDRIEGIVIAVFGLRETGYLEEIPYKYLTAQDGKILFTNQNQYIIALGV